MDLLIVVRVGIQLQTVKRNSLHANRDFRQKRPYFGIESVLIHTQERWGVPEPD